jgi:3-phenylpropionate/trans-cinnamate dioxygenase ferredoxin reductase subunit
MSGPGIVIVGAGQAGLQAAISLREGGFIGSIRLIDDEGRLPYQRPPLSKAFMLGKMPAEGLLLRNQAYFDKNAIVLSHSGGVEAIDRHERHVVLVTGDKLQYDHLILATGARNRRLEIPGTELAGVYYLRSFAAASALRDRLAASRNVVVIGGGFIGMEFAAVAAKVGARVHVVEAGLRIMARAASPEVSAYFTGRHAARGTSFSFSDAVVRINGHDGQVVAVETVSRGIIPADLVLIGIGVIPNDALARQAQLAVGNGIVVDDYLVTSDPAISAIGDCASYPNIFSGTMLRLESVQNAVDHARAAAARLTGKASPYTGVPWFWSDQGDDKLQIAGIGRDTDIRIVRQGAKEGSFSVFFFRDDALVCVESVNRVSDHMAARALLKSGDLSTVNAAEVHAADFEMKARSSKEPANV